MQKLIPCAILLLAVLHLELLGVTPVHIGKFCDLDTSLYTINNNTWTCRFSPGPSIDNKSTIREEGIYLFAYLKKNSNQLDIYSFCGKIGSSIVPILNEGDKNYINWISFSCYMLDEDDSWETIVNYSINGGEPFFIVYDDNGTEILKDSGTGYYGVDFNNTYIIKAPKISLSIVDYDIWRIRTNIANTTPRSLSKTKAAQSPLMQIYGLSGGDYKVSLIPSSGNQVQFQMFDLMGRCIFSKQLENLKTPVTFTIPESNIPNSPFIAKVKDGNETLYKKQIPLK